MRIDNNRQISHTDKQKYITFHDWGSETICYACHSTCGQQLTIEKSRKGEGSQNDPLFFFSVMKKKTLGVV